MARKKRFTDDFEEYEVTEEHHPSKGGMVVRIIFYILILLVNCAIIFRVCMAENPKAVEKLSINETLRAAYAESRDDFEVYTQTVYDMYTEDGLYYSTGLLFCPTADQLQVSVRYNIRTVDGAMVSSPENRAMTEFMRENGILPPSRISGNVIKTYLEESVSLSEDSIKAGEYFAFRLADDMGNYYLPSDEEKITRILYVYHKLTFDGLTEEDSNFYVEIYPKYNGVPDYDSCLGRMKVYSIDRAHDEYKLSGSEKSKLS